MSRPDRPRRYVDPSPDCVIPAPAWLCDVLNLACKLGLHPSQIDAFAVVMGSAEAEEVPLPFLAVHGTGPALSVGLLWSGQRHTMEVRVFRVGDDWRTRLGLWREGEQVVDEMPAHPGYHLRMMLVCMFPGLFEADRGRPA